MLRFLILFCLFGALCSSVNCEFSIKKLLQRPSTTTSTTETTLAASTVVNDVSSASTTLKTVTPYFLSNNIPKSNPGCEVHFECKKKLKEAPAPKPCVKYCVKRIDCPNNVSIRGEAGQCAELNEQLILEEINAERKSGTVSVMQVAMIDFPCQPGYLPDSRGRCREVW